MRLELNYQFNCRQYVLHDGNDPILQPLDEIALAFDKESGTLHKHGNPELVLTWHQNAQKKFRDAGFQDMADDLVAIVGRFPLEEINRCLSTTGYVGIFYKKLTAGEIQQEPLFEQESPCPQ